MDALTVQSLLGIGTALIGVPALVAVIINVLKFFDIVKDGDAKKWMLLLSIAATYALQAWKIFDPSANIDIADESLANIAKLLGWVFTVAIDMKVGPAFHDAIRGIPLLGKSYTVK